MMTRRRFDTQAAKNAAREHLDQSGTNVGNDVAEILLDAANEIERLRSRLRPLRTMESLLTGIPSVTKLLAHFGEDGYIGHVDWGPDADTVEKRATILLETFDGTWESRQIDTSEL